MPPKFKFTREEIVQKAVELTRAQGIGAVTARALADALGSSSKPIFSLFKNMEEVDAEIKKTAENIYRQYTQEDIASGKYPPYKACGMAYIRFAKEEPELFKLLFMCERTRKQDREVDEEITRLYAMLQKTMGLSPARAALFHAEMWIFVHGIAAMIATKYLDWRESDVSAVMTDMYEGLKHRFLSNL